MFFHSSLLVCLYVRINLSCIINTIIKLFLLVETEQSDEDQDEADPSHELKEEELFENDATEDDDNDDESGIVFIEFRFVFATLLY